MSNVLVRQELETRLATFVSSNFPGTPVAWQNIAFTKPANGFWLEAFLIPNITPLRSVDGRTKTFYGLFQVNVWAKAGIGMRQAEVVADALQNSFPVTPKYGAMTVEKTTVNAPIRDDSGWVAVPVLINYRYDT